MSALVSLVFVVAVLFVSVYYIFSNDSFLRSKPTPLTKYATNDVRTKWAMIAGASEGLGSAFAFALAERGFNVFLIARRAALLEETKQQLLARFDSKSQSTSQSKSQSKPLLVRTLTLDLASLRTDSAALTTLTEMTKDIHCTMLVYNAAYAPIGLFLSQSPASLSQCIDVNCASTALLVHAVVKQHMIIKRTQEGQEQKQGKERQGDSEKTKNRGCVILMSSLAGNYGSPKIATYAATKAFNTTLAEGLWYELKEAGIAVVGVIAGAVRTPNLIASSSSSSSSDEPPGALSSSEVVNQTLDYIQRTDTPGPTVVIGSFNRFASLLMSALPSSFVVGLMAQRTMKLKDTH